MSLEGYVVFARTVTYVCIVVLNTPRQAGCTPVCDAVAVGSWYLEVSGSVIKSRDCKSGMPADFDYLEQLEKLSQCDAIGCYYAYRVSGPWLVKGLEGEVVDVETYITPFDPEAVAIIVKAFQTRYFVPHDGYLLSSCSIPVASAREEIKECQRLTRFVHFGNVSNNIVVLKVGVV